MSAMRDFSIDVETVRVTLARLCDALEAQKERLNALDAAVGDGDMGISVGNGMRAVRARLSEPAADVGSLLVRAGDDFEDSAGATIGALVGAALQRAGHALAGKTVIGLPDIAAALEAAEAAIRARGKAEVGDKTLLDVLVPLRTTLTAAIEAGVAPPEAGRRLRAAAEAGVAATVPLRAKFGRGRWLAERTEGHPDPGATLLQLMVQSVLDGPAAQGT